MLAKLAVLVHRVPHAVFVLAIFVVAAAPRVIVAITGTPLAPYVGDVQDAVLVATAILGLAKQLNPNDPRADAVDLAIARAAKGLPPLPVLLLGLWALLLALVLAGCGATPAQIKTDLTTALNLENAGCSVADTTGNTYVTFGCALATIGLNTAIAVDSLFVQVPASSAGAFASAHPETVKSKPLVALWKTAHPGAAVGALP